MKGHSDEQANKISFVWSEDLYWVLIGNLDSGFLTKAKLLRSNCNEVHLIFKIGILILDA